MMSSEVIMPRSPWLASAAWTKNAGVPVDARVAAILRATWPDLPTPLTMTRPRAARIFSTAALKKSPSVPDIAAASATMPSRSGSSVRSAEAMNALTDVLPAARSDELAARCGSKRNAPLPDARLILPQTAGLFAPRLEGVGERALAGRALLHGQDGTAVVVVDDENVEPRPLLEQLDVALHLGIGGVE